MPTTTLDQAAPAAAASTAEHREPAARLPLKDGPVLLGTDGSGASHAPAAMAQLIARRTGRALRAVTVVEPTLAYAGTTGLAPMPVVVDESSGPWREAAARRFLASAWLEASYELEMRYGPVAPELAWAARDCRASLVVVGAAPRLRRQQTLSGVLAAQLLHRVHCPVLSVTPGLDRLPREAIAAIDFGSASIKAAHEAARLVVPGGTLTLLHVMPLSRLDAYMPQVAPAATAAAIDQARHLLERLRTQLSEIAAPNVTIAIRVVTGIVDDEIIGLANTRDADMLAVGTHGPGLLERVLLGSVATRVVHLAPCSVLASPQPGAAERAQLELDAWGTTEMVERDAWATQLDAFTRRNAGRPVRLEVDDERIGAQRQVSGYAFRGVTFDRHDARVELMLASERSVTEHLTRTVPAVLSVSITREGGKLEDRAQDRALQLRTAEGVTLLLFER